MDGGGCVAPPRKVVEAAALRLDIVNEDKG